MGQFNFRELISLVCEKVEKALAFINRVPAERDLIVREEARNFLW